MAEARLMLAALLLAVPAQSHSQAQPIPADRLLAASHPEAIVEYLRQLGCRPQRATDQTGDPWIRFGMAGMEGSIWFNDCDDAGGNCESIRLQLGLLSERKLPLASVNAFNNRYRFATLSLDEDGDPVLNHDIRMAAPGVPAAAFGWTVQQFESVAAAFRLLLNETEKAAD